MRYRNNGQGEDNILQNQFTTYLVTAIRWQKIAYLKKRTKLGTHELPTDFDSAFAQMLETQGTSAASVEQLAEVPEINRRAAEDIFNFFRKKTQQP